MEHRIEFEEYHTSQPDIQEWMERGVDVTEFFVDANGVEHFVFEETRHAYKQWLKLHKNN